MGSNAVCQKVNIIGFIYLGQMIWGQVYDNRLFCFPRPFITKCHQLGSQEQQKLILLLKKKTSSTSTPQSYSVARQLFYLFRLCQVFAALGLSLVAVSGATLCWGCMGFPPWWLLLSGSPGFRCEGFGSQLQGVRASVVVVHGLSCSMACGIFLHQGSNLCLLPWQTSSVPPVLPGKCEIYSSKLKRLEV